MNLPSSPSPTALPRVLVLDGHSNPALACVRSLGRVGYPVLVASHVRHPLGGWSRYCTRQVRYAGPTLAAFAWLRSWARAEGVAIVLPLSEESCALCNMEREAWEAAGMIVGCGPAEMLVNAFDKGRTLRAAQDCGLRIPVTEFPESLEQVREAGERLGFPCVVKPRYSQVWDGAAFHPSAGVRSVGTPADLERVALQAGATGSWPLVQEYVPGRGTGVFALYDHGRPVAWFAQESIRSVRPMASPNCLRRSAPVDPRLQEQAERLLSSFNWHGPAMVELRDDGRSEPWLMEVNGRFWVSLQLAVSAGVDFPRLWVEILRGLPVQGPETYRDVVLRWLWGDVKRFGGILVSGRPAGYTGPYPSVWQGLRELLGPQPPGTEMEMWQADDRWPALGEWVQAIRQTAGFLERRRGGASSSAAPVASLRGQKA